MVRTVVGYILTLLTLWVSYQADFWTASTRASFIELPTPPLAWLYPFALKLRCTLLLLGLAGWMI